MLMHMVDTGMQYSLVVVVLFVGCREGKGNSLSCCVHCLVLCTLYRVPLLVGRGRATGMQWQAPFVELPLNYKYNWEK